MARYTDHDEIAAHTLRICEDMREADVGGQFLYEELVAQCRTDPERMAQVLMCAVTWVPFENPPSTLADRAEGVASARAGAARWGVSA